MGSSSRVVFGSPGEDHTPIVNMRVDDDLEHRVGRTNDEELAGITGGTCS